MAFFLCSFEVILFAVVCEHVFFCVVALGIDGFLCEGWTVHGQTDVVLEFDLLETDMVVPSLLIIGDFG